MAREKLREGTLSAWGILIAGAVIAAPLVDARAQEVNPFEKGQDEVLQVEEEFIEDRLAYGQEGAPVELHAFLTTAFWWLGEQAYGSHADEGSSAAGRPTFITYSAYIDISSDLHETVFAEAEFELYKGQKGQFKVTKVRGVWNPSENFRLSIGRDFPPIGLQDRVYYPPSRFRLFTYSPYLYWSILRATGWWDSGLHASTKVPLGSEAWLRFDASVINGPGEQHQKDDNFLLSKMQPNSNGYMYENFHSKARQPWDNNDGKFFPIRLTVSPLPGLEVGASWMEGHYDDDDERLARYIFAHLLYAGDRLTVAAEYGQLTVEVDPENMKGPFNADNGTKGNDHVTQRSAYASAGYAIVKDGFLLSLEPVLRLEFMDSWTDDSTDRGDRFLAWFGFRIKPVVGWTIKVAGALQTEPGGPDLDNNAFTAEAVYDF